MRAMQKRRQRQEEKVEIISGHSTIGSSSDCYSHHLVDDGEDEEMNDSSRVQSAFLFDRSFRPRSLKCFFLVESIPPFHNESIHSRSTGIPRPFFLSPQPKPNLVVLLCFSSFLSCFICSVTISLLSAKTVAAGWRASRLDSMNI